MASRPPEEDEINNVCPLVVRCLTLFACGLHPFGCSGMLNSAVLQKEQQVHAVMQPPLINPAHLSLMLCSSESGYSGIQFVF